MLVVVVELRHLEGRETANIYTIRFTLAALNRDGTPIALVSAMDVVEALRRKIIQALRLDRKEIRRVAGVLESLINVAHRARETEHAFIGCRRAGRIGLD